MLRIVSTAIREAAARISVTAARDFVLPKQCFAPTQCIQNRYFGALSSVVQDSNSGCKRQSFLLNHMPIKSIVPLGLPSIETPVRTVTKFSLKKGKRKSVKTVLGRFYRLNWGIWIRTRAGRHKHLWKKSSARKRRLRQHVLVNATQSTLLDKMVTKFWKRPHYYVDDPYTPYHKREEFPFTRKKPLP